MYLMYVHIMYIHTYILLYMYASMCDYSLLILCNNYLIARPLANGDEKIFMRKTCICICTSIERKDAKPSNNITTVLN